MNMARRDGRPHGFPSSGASKMVIFDSSFLMAVSEKPTTWFEDIAEKLGKFDPVMMECVRRELKRLASSQGKKSRLARVAMELGKSFNTVPCGEAQVDDEIASAALSMKALVATADSELAKGLRSMKVGVIALRSGRVWVDG